ncbi:hypothetical protein B0H17DRAFT_1130222 [Mycena rosella]|uniref:Uncharacterized protein n=1 Tax=Mycena rosella TaxID=1033263 RepID=A0AAD7GPD5_MYCRO|nr:hypothetical protein B0H17DRAFT_1130222 [Mycena rosella]
MQLQLENQLIQVLVRIRRRLHAGGLVAAAAASTRLRKRNFLISIEVKARIMESISAGSKERRPRKSTVTVGEDTCGAHKNSSKKRAREVASPTLRPSVREIAEKSSMSGRNSDECRGQGTRLRRTTDWELVLSKLIEIDDEGPEQRKLRRQRDNPRIFPTMPLHRSLARYLFQWGEERMRPPCISVGLQGGPITRLRFATLVLPPVSEFDMSGIVFKN